MEWHKFSEQDPILDKDICIRMVYTINREVPLIKYEYIVKVLAITDQHYIFDGFSKNHVGRIFNEYKPHFKSNNLGYHYEFLYFDID